MISLSCRMESRLAGGGGGLWDVSRTLTTSTVSGSLATRELTGDEFPEFTGLAALVTAGINRRFFMLPAASSSRCDGW